MNTRGAVVPQTGPSPCATGNLLKNGGGRLRRYMVRYKINGMRAVQFRRFVSVWAHDQIEAQHEASRLIGRHCGYSLTLSEGQEVAP